jgi:membrane protease YdiL (CAAX protease family)
MNADASPDSTPHAAAASPPTGEAGPDEAGPGEPGGPPELEAIVGEPPGLSPLALDPLTTTDLPRPPPPVLAPRLRALLEVVACSGYPSQILIALLLGLTGLAPGAGGGPLTLRGLSMLLALDSLVLVLLVVWFLRATGEAPSAVLFGARRWPGEAALGLSLMPTVFLLVIAVGLTMARLAPWLRPPVNPFGALLGSSQDLVVLALIGLIAGGLREEVQRAFILHRFEQHLGGATVGLVCFSLLFGLGHVVQGWAAVVTTALLGAFWGFIYLRRRSIVAPMVSHATFNLIQTAFFRLQA